VKKVDPEFEVVDVAEAIGFAFEDFDLVVEPLDRTGGDGMTEVVEDAIGAGQKPVGEALESCDITAQALVIQLSRAAVASARPLHIQRSRSSSLRT